MVTGRDGSCGAWSIGDGSASWRNLAQLVGEVWEGFFGWISGCSRGSMVLPIRVVLSTSYRGLTGGNTDTRCVFCLQ
jgi:hypothetical protein